MTRPAGTTPRGLPYPGSGGIHADTPAALQALAEAITAQLSSIGQNTVFDFWVGLRTCDSTGKFTVPFANLAACDGGICSYGVNAGGTLRNGWAAGLAAGGVGYMVATLYGENFNNTTVTINAVGWGPPK